MRRSLSVFLAALALAPVGTLGVACSSGTGAPPIATGGSPDASSQQDATVAGDAGPPEDSSTATDATDAAADADAGPADAASFLLVPGPSLHLLAVTTDGLVIYWGPTSEGGATNSVFAVPRAGGTPTAILGPYSGHFYVSVYGPDVFVWDLVGTTSVGALSLWTQAQGAVSLSTASVEDNVWPSPDYGTVLYSTNATDTQKDIWVAQVDGGGAAALLTGAYRDSCPVGAVLAGGNATIQHCDQPLPDGGSALPPTLTFFPGAAVAGKVDLATLPANNLAYLWNITSAGDALYTPTDDAPQKGELFALPGATSTTLDPNGANQGFFVDDGGAVLYQTTTGALRRTPVASPAPTTLVPSGANGFVALSPDETHVAFFTQSTVSSTGVQLTDLSVASATTPDSGVQAVVAVAAVLPIGASGSFSADSTNIVYVGGTPTATTDGTLYTVPLDGGQPTQLGTNVIADTFAGGALLVFGDNYDSTADTFDLRTVNLATPGVITLVAQTVASYRSSATFGRLFYSTGTGDAGIYSVPLP